jgi:TetR/AcrR family transcriptional regulator, regulator of autoinduction and epiphytic fitness
VRHASQPSPERETDRRIARTRSAVLRAATDLLVEGGPSAVTIDAIVARSGVAKSTIYRHWESRDEVLVDVIETCAPTLVPPDPELGFEHAVRAVVDQVYAALNDPEWARMIPALLLLKAHQSDIAKLEERIGRHQDDTLQTIVAMGVAEGSLQDGADVEEIAAQLVGPLVFAHLTGRPRVTKAFAQRVADAFLRANAAGAL